MDEIFKQLLAVGKKAGLANIELIQGVVLSDEEWTPASVSLLLSLFPLSSPSFSSFRV